MGRPKDSGADLAKERLPSIFKFLSDRIYPDEYKHDKGKKSNWKRMCYAYAVVDGVLYKRRHREGKDRLIRVIMNEDDRREILETMHNNAVDSSYETQSGSGHMGRDKMLKLISERYYWPGLCNDIRSYIATCDQCKNANSHSQNTPPVKSNPGPQRVEVPMSPWYQIKVDIVSMPVSKEGFASVVIAVDVFTKWMEAQPLHSAYSAKDTGRFLSELICRHGCPKIEINDQSREFVDQVSAEVQRLTGMKPKITSAYRPQGKTLFDAGNHTIQSSFLEALQNEEDWTDSLPGILLTFRTAKQENTGFTPFFLVYGRKARLTVEQEPNLGQIPQDTHICDSDDVFDDSERPGDVLERLHEIEQLLKSSGPNSSIENKKVNSNQAYVPDTTRGTNVKQSDYGVHLQSITVDCSVTKDHNTPSGKAIDLCADGKKISRFEINQLSTPECKRKGSDESHSLIYLPKVSKLH